MEIDRGVEHRLGSQGEKSLGLLSNSKSAVVVEVGSERFRGKLGVRKGNNPNQS